MDDPYEPAVKERDVVAPNSHPIPLADRRRIASEHDQDNHETSTIRDWASI